MKEFAIYTVGNGELLAKGFNAVAMLMQEGGTMRALIRLGMFTGGLMALVTAFTRMQFQTLLMN